MRSKGIDVLKARLRRALGQRRTALFATAAAVAATAVPALATVPSHASVTPGSAIPASMIPTLRIDMLRLARYAGDAHPGSIRAVFTTQAKALRTATPGDRIPGSAHRPVYLVEMTGDFRYTHASVPPGARIPTGHYLMVTINTSTFAVMDLSVGDHKPAVSLRSYGAVPNLARRQG